MTEYQLIGSKYAVYRLDARILPERMLIADMIANHEGRYRAITETDYQLRVEKCEQERERIGS
jgi:hypothetical protein